MLFVSEPDCSQPQCLGKAASKGKFRHSFQLHIRNKKTSSPCLSFCGKRKSNPPPQQSSPSLKAFRKTTCPRLHPPRRFKKCQDRILYEHGSRLTDVSKERRVVRPRSDAHLRTLIGRPTPYKHYQFVVFELFHWH